MRSERPKSIVDASGKPIDEKLRLAAFDPDLILHMERCWKAMCDNAERLNRKVSLLVSALAILFGLGFFKIEWTVDPKHLSRIDPVWMVYPLKVILTVAMACFGRGLYLGLRGVRGRASRGSASDLLPFPEEIVRCPPESPTETRALAFYRLEKAVTELGTQNSEKAARIVACEKWLSWGLVLVTVSLLMYIWSSVPPMMDQKGGAP